VSTDNAYVRQDKVSVSAEVGGKIIEVAVRENQHVKAGDLLFRIDPEPYRLAIAEAEAAIANAEARLDTLQTNYATSDVDIDKAKTDVAFYETEYRRQQELMKKRVTTKAALDAAEHALSEARSKLASANADAAKAKAALSTGHSRANVNPAVLSARVQKDKALLNLARTEVRAPADGIVSQSSRLQVGQLMVQGLSAVSIVKDNVSWVEANFKETDLEHMRIGQPAKIEVDTYSGVKLNGHVESIGAGTGSEFSILPAQNATGNWVKVTQRVPVRIAIDDKSARPLIAGLSAYVRINISK
jgi:membrane fusion protein (multidrug efflux system)